MNNKNLIVFIDYINPFFIDTKKYNKICNNLTISFIELKKIWQKNKKLEFDNLFDEINDYLKTKKININNSIIILNGQIGLLLYKFISNLNPINIILINVPFVNTIINPYLSNNPSYKIDKKSFLNQLYKESHKFKNNINCINQAKLDELYDEYKINYEFKENINSLINDYIYLRKLRVKTFAKNNYFFIGKYNKNNNVKKQIKICEKNNVNYFLFKNSSYLIEFDEPKLYFNKIIEIIK